MKRTTRVLPPSRPSPVFVLSPLPRRCPELKPQASPAATVSQDIGLATFSVLPPAVREQARRVG